MSHSLLSGRADDEPAEQDGAWLDDVMAHRSGAADQDSSKLGGSESAQRLLLLVIRCRV